VITSRVDIHTGGYIRRASLRIRPVSLSLGTSSYLGRRLTSGDDERHSLVADLLVGQGLAVLVPGGQQHRQEVCVVLLVAPVRVDDLVHDAVDAGACGLEPAVGSGRQPFQRHR
jgi:hypothetical protein